MCEAFFGVSTSSPILGLDRPVGDDDLGVQCSGYRAGNHFFTCVGMQTTVTMLEMGWDEDYLLDWGEPLLLLLYVWKEFWGFLVQSHFLSFWAAAPRRRDNKRRDRCSYLLGVVRWCAVLCCWLASRFLGRASVRTGLTFLPFFFFGPQSIKSRGNLGVSECHPLCLYRTSSAGWNNP